MGINIDVKREIGVRQLDQLIGHLQEIRAGVEAGILHYRTGGLVVSVTTDRVEHYCYPDVRTLLPGNKTIRVHGDISFGTEKEACPVCNDEGHVYEGGMSMNPEVDNQVPCPKCGGDDCE